MIDEIETLDALEKFKTMSKAATYLRVTQSAVSKRIALLEQQVGQSLIERKGRNVALTLFGLNFLEKARPLLIELKNLCDQEITLTNHRLLIGMSESILSSWGPKLLKKCKAKLENFEFVPHAHRSPVVIDRVRSGEYSLGICAGKEIKSHDLVSIELTQEPMVIISTPQSQELGCIEKSSQTWQSIKEQVSKNKIKPTMYLESFFSLAQMANYHHFNALVPISVAKSLNIDKKRIKKTKIKRPIILIGRKTVLSHSSFEKLIEVLSDELTNQLKSYI